MSGNLPTVDLLLFCHLLLALAMIAPNYSPRMNANKESADKVGTFVNKGLVEIIICTFTCTCTLLTSLKRVGH